MKLLLLLLMIVLIGCNSADVEKIDNNSVTESIRVAPEDIFAWSVNPDSATTTKNTMLPYHYLQVDSLIRGLNARFPEILLQKERQSNDTLYTRIEQAEHLTQRMGSSGPDMYFAAAFFNLTAVPGIRYVKIDMQQGDHAGPVLLRPEDYKNYKERSFGPQ